MGVGLLAAGAGAGTALGVQAARNARRERKDKKIMFGKSAFGVSKAATWSVKDRDAHYDRVNRQQEDKEKNPEKYRSNYVSGPPDPDGWKTDLKRQPAPPKPEPKSYPKSGGIDPERKRLRRMGRWETAAATGALAAGGTTAVALGARPAADKIRTASQNKADELYARPRTTNPQTGRWFKNYKGKRITQAHKDKWAKQTTRLLRVSDRAGKASTFLRKVPTGKIAIGAGAATAGLAGSTVAIREYRKKNGRSYTDWWDG